MKPLFSFSAKFAFALGALAVLVFASCQTTNDRAGPPKLSPPAGPAGRRPRGISCRANQPARARGFSGPRFLRANYRRPCSRRPGCRQPACGSRRARNAATSGDH